MWKPQLAWTYIGLGVLADIFLENTGTSAPMFLGFGSDQYQRNQS